MLISVCLSLLMAVVRGNGRLEVTVAIERARADDREAKQEGK